MKPVYRDCYAALEGTRLAVGNTAVERVWDLGTGAPRVLSIRDRLRGREWARPAPFPDAFRRADLPLAGTPSVSVEAHPDTVDGTADEHLLVQVRLEYAAGTLTWRHRLWPGFPVILSEYTIRRTGAAAPSTTEPMHDDGGRLHLHPSDDRLDFFGLTPPHMAYESMALYGRSDHRDNLVRTRSGAAYPKEPVRESGHWFHVVDRVQPGGLLALKLAPPPDEQLQYPGFDFVLSGRTLAITGSGVSPAELVSGEPLDAYLSGVGVTDGSRDSAVELFYGLDRHRHRPDPGRTFMILSNTWGDGNGTKRIGEAMMAEELRAGAALGLTHCQLDAGWQKGNVADLGVEENRPKGPYGLDPDFWAVHASRFPRGLAPLAELARTLGIKLGFWFNPDGSNEYAHWRKDAEVVLGMWRDFGFQAVKIDGVSVHSKTGEARFLAFLRALHEGSRRQLCVNYDITGGGSRRTGHVYGAETAGTLFIENRYTRDGTYYPFRTLRNLWQLCQFLPSYRLQMEFANTDLYPERYAGDPLAPAAFGIEYACATVLFANPLAWMETARLAPARRRALARLIRAFKPHQKAVLLGRVYPIGEEPTGRAWTGLQSVTGPRRGYLALFREWTDRPSARFALRGVAPHTRLALERIAGAARSRCLTVGRDGTVTVSLPGPRRFALLRYGPADEPHPRRAIARGKPGGATGQAIRQNPQENGP